jgi:hypothetical protein
MLLAESMVSVLVVAALFVTVSLALPLTPRAGSVGNQVNPGMHVECGFITACTAYGHSGLALALSINSTAMKPNGSLQFEVTLLNPTTHYVNMSSASEWYLPGLPNSWPCHPSSVPYAFSVFRGTYKLTNVSSARNILHPIVIPSCLNLGNTTSFSIPPLPNYPPSFLQQSSQLYAVNGGSIRSGNLSIGVYSLWSSSASTYTMVAGDEWGDFVLLNFAVVP